MRVASDSTLMLLLAAPIAHVRSITVMNGLLEAHGSSTVVIPAHVDAEGLADAIRAIKRMRNVCGAAVTMPHKATVGAFLDRLTERAARCGSCNVIRREPDGTLVGDSTDGVGFVADLRAHDIDLTGAVVLIVGAGGAARSIAHAVAGAGARAVFLRSRRGAQAREAVASLNVPEILALNPNEEPSLAVTVAVNCTPVGLDGRGMPSIDVDSLQPQAVVCDIVMTDEPTPLLSAAEARGLTAVSGHGMLGQQLRLNLAFAHAW